MKERKTSVYLKKKKSKALLTPFLAGLFLVLCLSLNVFAADTSEADAVIPFSAAEAVKTDQTGTSGMTSKLLKSFSLLPLQSTAADIAKIALFRFDEALKKDFPDARIVLQIHDSIVCECREEDADAVEKLLVETMEAVSVLKVPLKAEPKRGHSLKEV